MDEKSDFLLYDGKQSQKLRPRGSTASPRGRPTREQSEKRHNVLLDHALELFLERGFERTSIEAIVDGVGMARRTVYARYGDKHVLFKAALQRLIDDLVVSRETLEKVESDDLEATLLNLARQIVANMRTPDGQRLSRLANAEVFQMPEIGAYFWENTGRITITYLTDLFNRRLCTASAAEAALSFYALAVDGSFRSWLWLQPSEEEFQRQMVYRVRLFLAGAKHLAAADGETGDDGASSLARKTDARSVV